MEKHIRNKLGLENISDIRLRINFAKEYVITQEPQEGLYNLVKSILDSVVGLLDCIFTFFKCFGNIATVLSQKREQLEIKEPKSATEFYKEMARIKEESKVKGSLNVKIPSKNSEGNNLFEEKESVENNVTPWWMIAENEKRKSIISINEEEVKDWTTNSITPLLVHILEKLWQYRFDVNPLCVYIIEITHKWSLYDLDIEQTPQTKRDLAEKYLTEFTPIWKIIRSKTALNFPDSVSDIETHKEIFITYLNQIFEIAQSLSVTKYEETLALHLSQTPFFHLKDVLQYQEKKREYQGNLRNLVDVILIEYPYLFTENQFHEIKEWLNKEERETLMSFPEPKIEDKRLIRINSEYIMPIASAFVGYFDEVDMNIFIKLLGGEKMDCKITFLGNAAQLVYPFRLLIESKKTIISNQKKDLISWLINNFKFYSKDSKENEDLKLDTVKSILSRSGFKEPRNLICFPFDC